MLVELKIDGAFVSLVCSEIKFAERREFDAAPLARINERYRHLVQRPNPDALLLLGRDLYDWLNGAEGWLGQLLATVTPPTQLEVRGPREPKGDHETLLRAPWEILADAQGLLTERTSLRFAPARRLGEPGNAPTLDDYRLGVTFMASSPRDVQPELDFEDEENALLTATPSGIDLLVEDSGDPQELGRRLAALDPTPPILHLSCHGDNLPRPTLAMEDAEGQRRATTADKLIEALDPVRPHLLVLSACLTSVAGAKPEGEDRPAHSLATSLVSAGFPTVLAWDGSVADAAATTFARELYEELAKAQKPALAAAAARRRCSPRMAWAAPRPARRAPAPCYRRPWRHAAARVAATGTSRGSGSARRAAAR